MFAGKKSAQIREILISESAWEEMTCLFAPSLGSVYATLIAYACAGYLFDILSKKTRVAFYQKTKALWIPGALIRLVKIFR